MTNREISRRLDELEQQLAIASTGREPGRIFIKLQPAGKHASGWQLGNQTFWLIPGESETSFHDRILREIPPDDSRKTIILRPVCF